jgi:anti-sigma factor RsiW
MAKTPHPSPEALREFILGRLDGRAMNRVERHLRDCDACARSAEGVDGDRLVQLMARMDDAPAGRGTDLPRGRSIRASIGIVLLALGAAGMLPGCGASGEGSIDFDTDPGAKDIGAPRRPAAAPAQPPAQKVLKKSAEFNPG